VPADQILITRQLYTEQNRARLASSASAAFGAAIIGLAVAACKPANAPSPTGQVRLEYLKSSDDEVTFSLRNESAQTIHFRGLGRTLSWAVRVWPGDTGFECEPTPGSATDEDPLGLADGSWGTYEVAPGKQVTMVIYTTFPQKYKGANCRIVQRLLSGTIVGPIGFRP
jgi:hypothetical protein